MYKRSVTDSKSAPEGFEPVTFGFVDSFLSFTLSSNPQSLGGES
jgi:hypothetical protein